MVAHPHNLEQTMLLEKRLVFTVMDNGTADVTSGMSASAAPNSGADAEAGSSARYVGTGNGGSGGLILRYVNRKYTWPELTYVISDTEETLPNITATSMTITPTENSCRVWICTLSASVTWTNNGESTGLSNLSITANSGIVTLSVYSSVEAAVGTPITRIFTISCMTVGSCSICPNPN